MSKVVLYNEVIFNEKKNKEQKYKVFIFEINFMCILSSNLSQKSYVA
jgi:hypothetical protein